MSQESCPIGMDIRALDYLTYGLYIATVRDGDKRNGCIVNTVVQVAGQPCQVTVSISKKNLTREMIERSGKFAVQVLEKETPLQFVGVFGFHTGRDFDKFEKVKFRDGKDGCPVVLEHTLASIEANVKQAVDCGSHTLFVGDVVQSEVLKPGEPLTYAYYHEVKGGKTGKNAPTYRAGPKAERDEASNSKGRKNMKKYVCTVCGYVYDPEEGDPDNGVKPGTPFDELPDEWVCPVCGAAKEEFEPQEE